MENLEARIVHLEAEVQRCVKQNRRMKALIFPVLALAATPFLLAWNRGNVGVFETVTAESFIVQKEGKRLAELGGVGTLADTRPRGHLRLYHSVTGPVAELGALDSGPYGILKLSGPKRPRFNSHIEMGVNTFGSPSLYFYSPNTQTTAALGMQVGTTGLPSMHFTNPPNATVLSIGSDNKGAVLRMADRDGKTTVLLDCLPKNIISTSASTARTRLPGRGFSATGGGGRLTLSDPTGAATFRAPAGATGN